MTSPKEKGAAALQAILDSASEILRGAYSSKGQEVPEQVALSMAAVQEAVQRGTHGAPAGLVHHQGGATMGPTLAGCIIHLA